jgi:hypothetical protein
MHIIAGIEPNTFLKAPLRQGWLAHFRKGENYCDFEMPYAETRLPLGNLSFFILVTSPARAETRKWTDYPH